MLPGHLSVVRLRNTSSFIERVNSACCSCNLSSSSWWARWMSSPAQWMMKFTRSMNDAGTMLQSLILSLGHIQLIPHILNLCLQLLYMPGLSTWLRCFSPCCCCFLQKYYPLFQMCWVQNILRGIPRQSPYGDKHCIRCVVGWQRGSLNRGRHYHWHAPHRNNVRLRFPHMLFHHLLSLVIQSHNGMRDHWSNRLDRALCTYTPSHRTWNWCFPNHNRRLCRIPLCCGSLQTPRNNVRPRYFVDGHRRACMRGFLHVSQPRPYYQPRLF